MLVNKLVPSRKKILFLEHGGHLLRERDNWNSETVFIENAQGQGNMEGQERQCVSPGIHHNVDATLKMGKEQEHLDSLPGTFARVAPWVRQRSPECHAS